MKEHIQELLSQALLHMQRDGSLSVEGEPQIQLDRTKSIEHGDFASNIAMILSKAAGMSPRKLAELVVENLPRSRQVEKVEIAGPGFINFFLHHCALRGIVKDVLAKRESYGSPLTETDESVTLEYVSANPTGPLHVGHGRGAAYGASLANILKLAGVRVQREYYVNDNGRQMDILAVSVWLRYLELCGERVSFPDNGYRGDYIYDISRLVRADYGDKYRFSSHDIYDGLPASPSNGGDGEIFIDALIARARKLLATDGYKVFFDAALNNILADIQDDLGDFGVHYEKWFSEQELEDSGAVEDAIECLRDNGHRYVQDGATWFRASELGDEKDRVVIRENGRTTYFASDIAYIRNKLNRGVRKAIYVLGADHHGYVARLRAAAQGLGEDPDRLEILLVQFAILYRFGERVQMSTRSGQFITLRELREEVGNDAARFFYVMRSHEQHLDFDLDLAKSHSNENPVYYIQYAHARICSVFRNLVQMDQRHNEAIGEAALELLTEDHETQLMRSIGRFPEVVEMSARSRAPHQVAHYLSALATDLHGYYNAHQFLVDDENLRNARLNLVLATRIVLETGLKLLGVSAPEEM
ncbi:MAG TPA: arginine--tRNA ligase [Xanthomonadales bacterium]|nr:arginine--tRNA ligase [Xanthomonadales bacterium]